MMRSKRVSAVWRGKGECGDWLMENVESADLPDAPNVTVAALDWLDVADASSASHRRLCSMAPHRIFAADIVYDPDLFEPLCTVLRCALGSGRRAAVHEPYALIASTMRNAQTYSLFLTAISEASLCGL